MVTGSCSGPIRVGICSRGGFLHLLVPPEETVKGYILNGPAT